MKKIVYAGKEEGVFVFGSFDNYMNAVRALRVNSNINNSMDGKETSLDSVWKKDELRIDYLFRSKDKDGPITVLASGEENKISEFERVILEEHNRRKQK